MKHSGLKNIISTLLSVLSLLIIVLAIAGSVYGIVDLNQTADKLANNPSASGIDFLGVGMGYGIILFILSTLGLIISAVNVKLIQKKALRYMSVAEVIVSAILVIISIIIFYT